MRRIFKWLGIGVVGLVGALALAVIGAVVLTKRAIAKTWTVAPARVAIPDDPAILEEGKRLYAARGCADCHGADLGGRVALEDPSLGKFWGTNLTRGQGGIGAKYADIDWVRTVRHGIKPDGTPLLFMPSNEFYGLNDHDLGAIIAYAKSVPPVDREAQPHDVGVLTHILSAAGVFPLIPASLINHEGPRPSQPEAKETKEYGAYLVSVQCTNCHGEGLGGGPIPGAPPSLPVPTNLTPDERTGLGKWQRDDFERAMRSGKRPDGSDINPFMPWATFKNLNDVEINALWAYLRSVPAKDFGTR